MAYEIFYAFTTTSIRFEMLAFLAWFALDLSFAIVALRKAHAPAERRFLRRNMVLGCLTGIAFLWTLTRRYPDEREQVTAYWTGIILQLPIGWICLYQLWEDHSTQGHSLEIWYVHCMASKIAANDQAHEVLGLLYCLWSLPLAILQCPSELEICLDTLEHWDYYCHSHSRDGLPNCLSVGAQDAKG